VINGKTEMARLNPKKQEDLYEGIEAWQRVGYDRKNAEIQAFEEFKSLYHVDNKDADF